MRLYQGNAKDLVGKKIDLEHRIGGYYPMEVIEIDGIPYVKDAVGVCMPIPDKEDDFNSVYFDFVIDKTVVYIQKEDLSKYWETNAICIEFADGTDALAQENGYTLEQCFAMTDAKFFLD